MRIVLEPRCPKSVNGISFDPDPNWTFESLISELKSIEKKLSQPKLPKPITKTISELKSIEKKLPQPKLPQPITKTISKLESNHKSGGAFVMRVSEYEMESIEEENGDTQICRKGKRFGYRSDESDDDFVHGEPERMVNKIGLAEIALCQMIKDNQTQIKEDIRNQVRVLEKKMMNETETYRSAIARIENYYETRKEVERKLDLQYKQKRDEALQTHMAEIKREHEMKMQIEERKIRSEEEAIRREKAHQEMKMQIEERKIRSMEEAMRRERDHQEKKIRQEKPRRFTRKATKYRKTAEQKLAEEKAVIERLNGAEGKTIQAAESAVTFENQWKKRRV